MKFIKKHRDSHTRGRFFLRIALWALLFVGVLGVWAAGPPAASIEPIVLKAEPLSIKPKEFYIAAVEDERQDKKAVAYLFPAAVGQAPATKAVAVDLAGGGKAAIQEYIRKSLPADTKLRPVVMHLKEVSVKESAPVNGRVEGRVLVHVAFSFARDDEKVPLIEHQGGIRYIRSANQLEVVEPALRKSLAESLRYFDAWMNKAAKEHIALANSLQVRFSDHTIDAKDDTVFYSLSRPLTWNDFQASSSKESRYAAAVFPGFAYEGSNAVKDGVIYLDLKMKVFVVKSASWVKAAARDVYTLNHEQRHFDITKLVAERFKQKLHPDSLTVADYNSIMQYKYIESYREMHHLQEQYDSETKHGTDEAAQQRWNQKIDEQLRALKVKK